MDYWNNFVKQFFSQKGILKHTILVRDGEDQGQPKAQSVRGIPVHPILVRMLREYLGGRTTGPLVATRSGKAVALSNLARSYSRAARKAGVAFGGRNLYALRHAHGSMGASAGVPPVEMARRMGHSETVFRDIYHHALPKDVSDTNALMDGMFD